MPKTSSTYHLHKKWLSDRSKCSESEQSAQIGGQNVEDFGDSPGGPDIASHFWQLLLGVSA
jgi:hypothetical protein